MADRAQLQTSTHARPGLVVFSDDWGRHPSSCQHLVGHLLESCRVTWVNTIGTRPPKLNLETLWRGVEKLRQWKRPGPTTDVPSNPRVINPLMWPGFRSAWQRRWNRDCIARCLRRNIPQLDECVVLTTLPIVADVASAIPAKRWVYYCVDDFSSWPGLDSQPLREMEQTLVARADRLVAAGSNLSQRLLAMERVPIEITHGVELEHWAAAQQPLADLPAMAAARRPRVLFWGLIDRRLDIHWVQALSERMPDGTLVFAGPEQAPDPLLAHLPNVRRTGPIPLDDLPAAAANADVLIMPYADVPVTRAMQPLKLKEYLATGKPVVVRRLPAVEPWEDCLDAATTAEDFVTTTLERITSGVPAEQLRARQRLENESWRAKAESLFHVLFDDALPDHASRGPAAHVLGGLR